MTLLNPDEVYAASYNNTDKLICFIYKKKYLNSYTLKYLKDNSDVVDEKGIIVNVSRKAMVAHGFDTAVKKVCASCGKYIKNKCHSCYDDAKLKKQLLQKIKSTIKKMSSQKIIDQLKEELKNL